MTSSGYRYLIERILHRTETVNIPVEQPTRFYRR